jgi:pimeloyl-ACP methyl ester carboxylesterase
VGNVSKTKSLYKSLDGERQVRAVYDAVLQEWQTPHQELYIATRQGTTFVLAAGDPGSPPLILLHGTNSNALYWLEDMEYYRRNFRVYAPDSLGEPGRSAQTRPEWNSQAYAQWLQDILDYLGIRKASFLGFSQGGWLAVKFAVFNPGQVNRLVLCSPAGIGPLRWLFGLQVLRWVIPGMQKPDKILELIFGEQPVPSGISRFSRPMFVHFISRKRIMPHFSDAELQELTMPVLLIVNVKDSVFFADKIAARLKKLLPENLTVMALPHAGHSIYGMAESVISFLSGFAI